MSDCVAVPGCLWCVYAAARTKRRHAKSGKSRSGGGSGTTKSKKGKPRKKQTAESSPLFSPAARPRSHRKRKAVARTAGLVDGLSDDGGPAYVPDDDSDFEDDFI